MNRILQSKSFFKISDTISSSAVSPMRPVFAGDVVGVEVEVFEVNMSVALFSKNGSPVGTRFITQTDHSQFLPTLAICGNGAEVVIDVVWQNRVSEPPVFNVVCV